MIGIYGIFNNENNECLYVGQSKDIDKRYAGHMNELINGNHIRTEFVDWFNVECSSIDDLKMRVLSVCDTVDRNEMNILEIKWFNELKPKFFGKKPSLKDTWTFSKQTLNKLSEANKTHNIYNDEIVNMYSQGFSLSEIAEVIPRSRPGVLAILNKNGVETNGFGYQSKKAIKSNQAKIITKTCSICGIDFVAYKMAIKTCSVTCSKKLISLSLLNPSITELNKEVYNAYKSGKSKAIIMTDLNISYGFLNKCIEMNSNK